MSVMRVVPEEEDNEKEVQGAAAAGLLRCEREGVGGTREKKEEAELEIPSFEMGTGMRQGETAVSTRIEKEVGESGEFRDREGVW